MTDRERIEHICHSQAALFERNARAFEGEKRAKREGAAKAYRIVAESFAHYEPAVLRDEMLNTAEMCCKQAHDIRLHFPILAASFEGHAVAYRDIAGLCKRLIECAGDGDLWDHDAQREEVSARQAIKEYREDVRRGSLP